MSLPIRPSRHELYDFISYNKGLKDAARGKRVLITGAGTGIGKVIATHFAIAGASTLFLAGRRTKPLHEVKGAIKTHAPQCDIQCIPTDVTNQSSVEILFATAENVDVLVNNAGNEGDRNEVGDSDVDKWWQGFEINVKGTYLVTRMYLRFLGGAPGVVINVSSRSSYMTGSGGSSYGTSKTAMNRFTEYISHELSNQGVRCIAMHPGGIAGTSISSSAPEWIQKFLIDSVDLPAGTALYLSTQRAAYLNGRYVDSRWDMEELERHREAIEQGDLLKTRILGLSED